MLQFWANYILENYIIVAESTFLLFSDRVFGLKRYGNFKWNEFN